MKKENVIQSLSKRGNGEIYLGVVGAVRTGKSTFIKRFIENLVVPCVEDNYEKQKCLDELPQSGQGKQITTTEPKFVPSSGVTINVDNYKTNIKLVDCVGYVINDSQGFLDENGNPRMVKSPWYEDYIPLTKAAEIGTQKVIHDHATIAIVVTTDGTITGISRENYVPAEEKVINELKEIGKPYIILLNSTKPKSEEVILLGKELERKYNVPVIATSVDSLKQDEIMEILKTSLNEFRVNDLNISIPKWINLLPNDYELKTHYLNKINEISLNINKLKDVENICDSLKDNQITDAYISNLDAGTGTVTINLNASEALFESTLNEIMGNSKLTKSALIGFYTNNNQDDDITELKKAIKMAKKTGYSILHPTLKDMKIETPEIIKQGSRYGVKIKTIATSLHLVKVDVDSTFEPIIGSEAQSKELIDYLMKENADIWQSEMFGRSLEEIVKESIQAKLNMMPDNTRFKIENTITKVVNKGANNLIAIVI